MTENADPIPTAENDAGSRSPMPGTVAVVTMMRRPATVALFDGVFWRGCDARGPIKCVPAAITSIETPYVFSPAKALDDKCTCDHQHGLMNHKFECPKFVEVL